MTEARSRLIHTALARLLRSLYGQCTKKGLGTINKGNRTLCLHRNFRQAIMSGIKVEMEKDKVCSGNEIGFQSTVAKFVA